MRISVITCLLLAALAGLGIRWATYQPVAPAYAEEHAVVQALQKPSKVAPQSILWEKKIESHLHAQVEDARNEAFEDAANQLHVYLLGRNPAIQWRPSADFVRTSKLVKNTEDNVVKLDLDENSPDVRKPDMHQIVLQLSVTDTDMKAIRQEDHKFRVEQRLWTAGRGLGGFVLLLGALAGYMRLDELTKGYFTLPLRLGALLLGVVGAGVIWFVV
jgi:hypothetical protein